MLLLLTDSMKSKGDAWAGERLNQITSYTACQLSDSLSVTFTDKNTRAPGHWVAQSREHVTLDPRGHEREPHVGSRDYFLKKRMITCSVFNPGLRTQDTFPAFKAQTRFYAGPQLQGRPGTMSGPSGRVYAYSREIKLLKSLVKSWKAVGERHHVVNHVDF